MTIEILDIVIYFILAFLIWKLLPEDMTKGLGITMGISIITIFTFVYTVIFCFLSWHDDIITPIINGGWSMNWLKLKW